MIEKIHELRSFTCTLSSGVAQLFIWEGELVCCLFSLFLSTALTLWRHGSFIAQFRSHAKDVGQKLSHSVIHNNTNAFIHRGLFCYKVLNTVVKCSFKKTGTQNQ